MTRPLAALMIFVAVATSATAQIDWTPYANNPVITPSFDTESAATYRPSVVKWNGRYHLWYGKLWQGTRWTAYAISDDGINWGVGENDWDNAVLGPSGVPGTFDELEATYGWVIVDGDTLKMWYSGLGLQESGIGLAWSTDGFKWTRVAGAAGGNSVLSPATDGTQALAVTHPTVVKVGETYHMWYTRIASGSTARIGYATSQNGLSWEITQGSGEGGAVLDVGVGSEFDALALLWPAVLNDDGRFEMWYQGLGPGLNPPIIVRIGCAQSNDGITWQKIASATNEAGECFRSLAQPSVILEDDTYKMWYGLSAPGNNGDVVMYATSPKVGTATEQTEAPWAVTRMEVYPNPMATNTTIRFSTRESGVFQLEAHDLLGRTVSIADLGVTTPGEHEAIWAALDARGRRIPTGGYFLTISEASSGARSASKLVYVMR